MKLLKSAGLQLHKPYQREYTLHAKPKHWFLVIHTSKARRTSFCVHSIKKVSFQGHNSTNFCNKQTCSKVRCKCGQLKRRKNTCNATDALFSELLPLQLSLHWRTKFASVCAYVILFGFACASRQVFRWAASSSTDPYWQFFDATKPEKQINDLIKRFSHCKQRPHSSSGRWIEANDPATPLFLDHKVDLIVCKGYRLQIFNINRRCLYRPKDECILRSNFFYLPKMLSVLYLSVMEFTSCPRKKL